MDLDLLLDLIALTQPYVPVLLTTLALTASALTSGHVLLSRREPGSAIAWIALVWLAPLLGVIAYLIFGINRIKRRAEMLRPALHHFHTEPAVDIIAPEELRQRLPEEVRGMHHLLPLVDRVSQRPLLPGAKLTPLFNGDEAFPAMIEAIDKATESINLATYIFDNDETGRQFVEALSEAQERGVAVRVLIDAAGLRYSFPSIYSRLKRARVNVARFLPSIVPPHFMTLNLRNHRKVLVVDGKIGFTGGHNIRNAHVLALDPGHPTRDLHFKVEGPVVAHLQEAFVDDWSFTTGEKLRGRRHFPTLSHAGTTLARGITDGPDEDLDKLKWTILGAITSAGNRVTIMTPYFIPDEAMISALTLAALRGVTVQIILPSNNNLPFVHWASMTHLRPLLKWGCQVYFQAPPFDHTKLMIVDGVWFTCGSANMDPRSLRLNFEFNLECWDVELATRLEAFVDERIAAASRLTMEEYEERSRLIQLRDGIAALLSPYL